MGRLSDFLDYLQGRRAMLGTLEKRLCLIQEKYETFFQEVERVREVELSQLTAHILAARSGEGPPLPEAVNHALDRACEEVERELTQTLKKLHKDQAALEKKAEALRQLSVRAEAAVHEKNVALDQQEEALKARNVELVQRIATYNQRIRTMSRGFGFLANLFRMRALARERRELEQQKADVVARVDQLRDRWKEAEKGFFDEERDRAERWVKLQTELSALATKINYLEQTAPEIRLRSTVERVLYPYRPNLPRPTDQDPECPRCGSHNAVGTHFCRICAQRLQGDRPDFEGSLEEIAELNQHHGEFQEGMKASQEVIGLVRGLISGFKAFEKSVEDVIDSENKYPLPPLELEVPRESRTFGEAMEQRLIAVAANLSEQPTVFAGRVKGLMDDLLTAEKIKTFFEAMGEELSHQAETQW